MKKCFLVLSLALLTMNLFTSIVVAGEEDLKLQRGNEVQRLLNPGFEERDTKKPDSPAAWTFYGNNWKISDQARTGKSAVNVGNNTFLRQRIAIVPEDFGKNITVKFYARGKGQLNFSFGFYKKVDASGKEVGVGGDKNVKYGDLFALTDEYTPYSFTSVIPSSAEQAMLHLGAPGPIDMLIDDVEVYFTEPAKTAETKPASSENKPENEVIPSPADDKLLNIAAKAKIRTDPWGFNVGRIADGIPWTGLTLLNHPWRKARSYEFIYSEPQTVAGIRFSMPSGGFSLWADTNGDGKYDKMLVMESDYPAKGYFAAKSWPCYTKPFSPYLKAYALKLMTFKDSKALMEFEILSPSKSISSGLPGPTSVPAGVPVLERGNEISQPVPEPEQRYLQGFHVEPWMFDCPGWIKKTPRPPLKEWPAFKKMMDGLKRMNCNLVWLFPPKTWDDSKAKDRPECTYKSDVMWPSQVHKYSYPEHLLKEFCDEMHGAGIEVFTLDRNNSCKITRPDNVPETPVIPWVSRELYKGSGAEMAAEGVDGVPIACDEAYFGGIQYPASCLKAEVEDPKKDEASNQKIREQNKIVEATRRAFAERWKLGADFVPPIKQEDTELFRKWQVFYYEQIADFMSGTSRHVKAASPKTKTVCNLVSAYHDNRRYKWGVAYDIIGWKADVDYLGTDPYHTQEDDIGAYNSSILAKSLIAGNRRRQAVVTLNGPWGWSGREKQPLPFEVYPPISLIGSVVAASAQGCQAYAFWRYHNIVELGYDKPVQQAFGILDTMAGWGAKKASIPKDIAVLRSRASEDWWQLKYMNDFSRDEILPYVHYDWIAEFLLRNGYPFELFYMDQAESYKNLSAYRLIVLPFPYSVGKDAFARIDAALKAGSKVMAMGAMGETDELGNAYPEPILKRLIDEKKIEYVRADIADVGHFPEFNKAFKDSLDLLLGDRKTLDLDCHGLDIQAGCLEKSAAEKFIIMVNWSGKEVPVDIGIRMPSGKYRILMRGLDTVCEIRINGRGEFTPEELRKFRVPMKIGEALVLYVCPAK